MHGELPASRTSHGKAPNRDAAFVDRVVLGNMLQGFKEVYFSSELVRIAISAVWMKDKSMGGRELPGRLLATIDKVQLAERLASAVKPNVETMAVGRTGMV